MKNGAVMSGQKLVKMNKIEKQRSRSFGAGALSSAAAGLFIAVLSTPVLAQQNSCETDMLRLKGKYEGVVASLSKQKRKDGKLDAAVACPKLKMMTSIDAEWIAYLTKNKDWCSVPDEALASMEERKKKDAAFTSQACNVAAQMKKMQEQQASGGAQAQPQVRLPAGPL
jgi:hypothetical protein